MARWENNAGAEVTTNDAPASLAAAKKAGWKMIEGPAEQPEAQGSTTVEDVVSEMTTKKDVAAYASKAFDLDLQKNLSLEEMKAAVIEYAAEVE